MHILCLIDNKTKHVLYDKIYKKHSNLSIIFDIYAII